MSDPVKQICDVLVDFDSKLTEGYEMMDTIFWFCYSVNESDSDILLFV